MTLPVGASRKVIYETHMPLGIGRNSKVTAPTIIVYACHHPMEAVLETCINSVRSESYRDQRVIEKV